MINISFENISSPANLKKVVRAAVSAALPDKKSDLSVVLCDDTFIQELNKTYREVDRPTDVLSFSSDEVDPATGKRYLGDIIISLPRAEQQAVEANHPLEEELSMLAVHGVLHLSGYDHHEPSQKEIMWKRQAEILLSLGIVMDKFSGDE